MGEVRGGDTRPHAQGDAGVAGDVRHGGGGRQGLRPGGVQAPREQGHPELPARGGARRGGGVVAANLG